VVRRLGRAADLLGIAALVLAAAGCGLRADPEAPDPVGADAPATTERLVGVDTGDVSDAVVGSITDGDTFRTTDGERVRIIGIDTPEVDEDACYATEATEALAAMIPPGTAVRLAPDVDPADRYGRTLAYVQRAYDDLDVGLSLAREGFAVQLTVPPNVARQAAIGGAVAEARAAGRGLWGPACTDGSAADPAASGAPVSAPPATPPPATAAPPPVTEPPIQPVFSEPGPTSGCDPSYPDVCIPPAPPDLDCPQIPDRRFTVVGADPHGFDGDHDGVGCEG
jgi:micrococcal nuclease